MGTSRSKFRGDSRERKNEHNNYKQKRRRKIKTRKNRIKESKWKSRKEGVR